MLDIQITFEDHAELNQYATALNAMYSHWFRGKRITKSVRFNCIFVDIKTKALPQNKVDNPYLLIYIPFDKEYLDRKKSIENKQEYIANLLAKSIQELTKLKERFNEKSISYLTEFTQNILNKTIAGSYIVLSAKDTNTKANAELEIAYHSMYAQLNLIIKTTQNKDTKTPIAKVKPYEFGPPLSYIFSRLNWIDHKPVISDTSGEIKHIYNEEKDSIDVAFYPNTMPIADLKRFVAAMDLDSQPNEMTYFIQNYVLKEAN